MSFRNIFLFAVLICPKNGAPLNLYTAVPLQVKGQAVISKKENVSGNYNTSFATVAGKVYEISVPK